MVNRDHGKVPKKPQTIGKARGKTNWVIHKIINTKKNARNATHKDADNLPKTHWESGV